MGRESGRNQTQGGKSWKTEGKTKPRKPRSYCGRRAEEGKGMRNLPRRVLPECKSRRERFEKKCGNSRGGSRSKEHENSRAFWVWRGKRRLGGKLPTGHHKKRKGRGNRSRKKARKDGAFTKGNSTTGIGKKNPFDEREEGRWGGGKVIQRKAMLLAHNRGLQLKKRTTIRSLCLCGEVRAGCADNFRRGVNTVKLLEWREVRGDKGTGKT